MEEWEGKLNGGGRGGEVESEGFKGGDTHKETHSLWWPQTEWPLLRSSTKALGQVPPASPASEGYSWLLLLLRPTPASQSAPDSLSPPPDLPGTGILEQWRLETGNQIHFDRSNWIWAKSKRKKVIIPFTMLFCPGFTCRIFSKHFLDWSK